MGRVVLCVGCSFRVKREPGMTPTWAGKISVRFVFVFVEVVVGVVIIVDGVVLDVRRALWRSASDHFRRSKEAEMNENK